MATIRQALVWGLGVSGQATVDWLIKNKYNVIVYDDYWDQTKTLFLHKKNLVQVKDFTPEVLAKIEFVVVSPGVSVWHDKYQYLIKQGAKIKTDISLFAENFKGITIAVTGTNGKSTMVSKIAHVAKKNGLKAVAAGNIGLPCMEIIDQKLDLVVLELSSFYLAHGFDSKFDFGILINIAPDHLNWHISMQHYIYCKQKIFDYSVSALNVSEGINSYGQKLDLSKGIISFLAKQLNWQDQCTKDFQALPHRLQEFYSSERLWVNDSKATNAHATFYACSRYNNIILILAGQSKGWINDVLPETVKQVILVGSIKHWSFKFNPTSIHEVANLNQAIELAYNLSIASDVILFSPGGASFDYFKNFSARGDYFMEQVKCLS